MAEPRSRRRPLPVAISVLLITLAAGPLCGHSGRSGGAGYHDLPAYEDIDVVHVVFTSHLDVGWTASAVQVINTYFQSFFPEAIRTAAALEKLGYKYSFTTYPWLLSLYLDCPANQNITCPSTTTCPWGNCTLACPTAAEREQVVNALIKGTITWQGHPLEHFPELMDTSLYKYGLSMSQDLAKFHGGTATLTASNRDVPGMTLGVIPLLRQAGVQALSIGVDSGVVSPAVPPVFWWKIPNSAEKLLMFWHPGGFGGIRQGDAVVVPGFRQALVAVFGGENTGYVTPQDVIWNIGILRSEFPNAKEIKPSTFDAFTAELLKDQKALNALPVIEQEIGDTWIYGESADPWKLAVYREMMRARADYLARGGQEDEAVKRFSRFLVKLPEHTTGINFTNYAIPEPSWSNQDFQKNASNCQFQWVQYSWDEQRLFLQWALNILGKDHPLAKDIRARLTAMQPRQPAPPDSALVPGEQWNQPFECGQWSLRFDERGAVVSLIDKPSGREWASPDHPLALLHYETFGTDAFTAFANRYAYELPPADWFSGAWGKPGLTAPPAARGSWTPVLSGLWKIDGKASCRFLLQTGLDPATYTNFGAPQVLWTELEVPKSGSTLRLDLQWFNKTATRLPETIWFQFQPRPAKRTGWRLCKLGQPVDPLAVVVNGNRHLHGVWEGVSYCGQEDGASFFLETLDAALVSPGKHEILDFDNSPAQPEEGIYVNLFNNLWGNDFPQWYPWTDTPQPTNPSQYPIIPFDGPPDARFRFALRFGDACQQPASCSK
jgi:uncharacterized protein DUF5054